MKSIEFRNEKLFLRNEMECTGKYEIPLMKKCILDTNSIDLLSYSDIRTNDSITNCQKGVHFYIDDYRFQGIYNNPNNSLNRLSQYKFLLTPDFSLYQEMPIWRMIQSVAMNRWVGCWWQKKGLTVVPTISWASPVSYQFCFDGVPKDSVVSIGMIGCKRNRRAFLDGYTEMLMHLNPSKIICFGEPFDEMGGNIISIDYMKSRKVVR